MNLLEVHSAFPSADWAAAAAPQLTRQPSSSNFIVSIAASWSEA
jgi:hypothetical protein